MPPCETHAFFICLCSGKRKICDQTPSNTGPKNVNLQHTGLFKKSIVGPWKFPIPQNARTLSRGLTTGSKTFARKSFDVRSAGCCALQVASNRSSTARTTKLDVIRRRTHIELRDTAEPVSDDAEVSSVVDRDEQAAASCHAGVEPCSSVYSFNTVARSLQRCISPAWRMKRQEWPIRGAWIIRATLCERQLVVD